MTRAVTNRQPITHSPRPERRYGVGLVVIPLLLALLLAGCGASTQAADSTKTTRPLPAGRYPSTVSKMVCRSEASHDLGLALGETAAVTTPTWTDHVYTCHYDYPSGSLTLSVKELSSWPETLAYFHGLGSQLGVTRTLANLGQGAFQTSDGSVVVRKDWKVLLVDSGQLPPQFGNPPTTSGDIAVTVADVILGCWAGD
jgi:hypothetical protein